MASTRGSHPDDPSRRDPSAPRSEDLAELLAKVRDLRLTLATDLSVAAGAIDDDQPEVARDIVAADIFEVRQLQAGARPVSAPARPRRRRALFMLPAIPLVGALALTGAAALSGPSHHSSRPGGSKPANVGSAAARPTDVRQTAATTLHRLERIVANHREQGRVVAVAAHLHHQLTALIATSPQNPKRLSEVQRLLAVEQQLLKSHHGDGIAIALAASRQVNRLLADAGLPPTLPTSLPRRPVKSSPSPVTTPTTKPKPSTSTPTKPRPTTLPTSVIAPPSTSPRPTPSATRHRHHHRHLTDPLLGGGLLDGSL